MSDSKLTAAFRNLEALSKHQISVESPQIKNARLPKVAEAIQTDRIQNRPVIDFNLLVQWREALRVNGVDHLTNREIRKLSWEPDVALSSQYLDEVIRRQLPLGRSLLKGFVYSLLSSWGDERSLRVLRLLEESSHVESTSSYLKKVAPFILTENGSVAAANALVAKRSTVQKTLSEIFGIALSTTRYAHSVFAVVIEVGHQKVLSPDIEDRHWFYAEVLQHVNKEVLLICLDRVVTAIDQSRNEEAKEEFKRFVLFHPNLGDPRLPGYEGNWPREKPITAKVIEWLSQSDIQFFFELFIEKQADLQGRKQFWLKYAHLVKGTRVIVSQYDQRRLARQISEMKQKSGTSNLFASLQETNEKSTAFLMDFGN
ncbi:MAG: EH signature domain-containing protein, partial [Pseudobdellovibrionaceae bacterium]